MQSASATFEHRLLAAEPGARPVAPHDVWDFGRHSSWHPEVLKLIEDFADEHVKSEFLKNPPEFVVSDDLGWLDEIVLRVHGRPVDSKWELGDRLRDRYRAIRAYHGTSVESFASFYTQGLNPLRIEEFHERARLLFLGGQFPELTEDHLSAAIEAVGTKSREGLVYFEANEGIFNLLAGHYLLYGSEYLAAIAVNLGGKRYQRHLKNRGQPTLFVCDVPLELLDDRTLLEFSGTAIASVFQKLLDGPDYAPDEWQGAGFSIGSKLDPACIVGHCHPRIERDPFAG